MLKHLYKALQSSHIYFSNSRIASILEHRHPLKDPSQPEHATKNRPDKISQQILLGEGGMLKGFSSPMFVTYPKF